MKLKVFFVFGILIAIVSCNRYDIDSIEESRRERDAKEAATNAEKFFGTIDPNQDWNSTRSGVVTVTADADLAGITKVQILTESPFQNPYARVLSETNAINGQTVSLSYDAPNVYDRLFVACVNQDGTYAAKGFNVSESKVSFQGTTTRASRRAGVSSYGFPALSNFVLPINKSFLSYNAIRAIRSAQGETKNANISLWKGKGWEKERFWRNNSSYDTKAKEYKITYSGSDWYMQNFSIRRDVTTGLTAAEKENLEDIFNTYLFWKDDTEENRRKNNLSLIRNSTMVSLYNNEMQSSGEPVIISPVQATSCEQQYCDLYYYYYKPSDVAGMTEAQQVQYIKELPKFMAMSCYDAVLNIKGSAEFFKNHEYVLPFYGDVSKLKTENIEGYTTDGKIYRIRNGFKYNDAYYYMVYDQGENNRLNTKYEDELQELPLQLWQIFKNADNTSCYLYNVGAQCFLYYSGSWNTSWTSAEYVEDNCKSYDLEITADDVYHFKRQNSQQRLGSDLQPYKNLGIWSDKNTTTGTCDWYLEEYDGNRSFVAKTDIQKLKSTYAAESFAIPEGYYIGFLLRKMMTNAPDAYNHYFKNTYNAVNNGEIYADGRLNNEINNYPNHFLGNKNTGIIDDNDPRASIFSTNDKTYVTFEDGSDANYVDLIIEVSNGIKGVSEMTEPEAEAYTMCFEDRPNQADYDMNDVVLRCIRVDATTLSLTLVATGANDDVVIRGATGWQYNDQEAHAIFHATKPDANGNRFVNTVVGGVKREVMSQYVDVDEGTTIPDFLKGIYIENKTTGRTIRLSQKGEPPFAIIVPEDFQYPQEQAPITGAYKEFIDWAQNVNNSNDWYRFEEADKIFPSLFNKWNAE